MKEGITTSFLSGKGGVGKSFITANIAIQLTKKGYKTAVIDCDLGFSNLSTLINRKVNFTVIDWINQRASLNDICDKAPQFTLLTVSNNFEHNTVNNETLFNALDQVIKYLKKITILC
jgi:MinD-like ATPase involved in chromosome partitioning or flagellar assembly